ncbi:unnamed protein product [Effrenium voratum]|nr:unnamed protein product [Effrenium voratum]
MDAAFSIFASKLSGEGQNIEGLVPSTLFKELKERICQSLNLHTYDTQVFFKQRVLEQADEGQQIGDLGMGEGAELEVVTCSFCRALPGRWEPAVEDYSAWMRRMTIAEDGTFTCQSGDITDGLVRLVSAQERKVNLKRTCHDALSWGTLWAPLRVGDHSQFADVGCFCRVFLS